ncbi:indolepyruvate oxidoreductase subunit beta [bacterium]|nr:indolepyruvate oxidoreductase subunit beta [candidate division CSSED10-310 bacterium]
MKRDIIISGVGGQGILSISYLICHAALERGWSFKQAEVHGMAQRGGAVQSHLRLNDREVFSDLIPKGQADLILSVEPLEVFRYLDFLSDTGVVITATDPFVNIPNYPDAAEMSRLLDSLPHKILVNADEIAKNIGNARVANTVMLGAAAPAIGFQPDEFDKGLAELFGRKGEKMVEINQQAVRAGFELATNHTA